MPVTERCPACHMTTPCIGGHKITGGACEHPALIKLAEIMEAEVADLMTRGWTAPMKEPRDA